MGKLLSEANQLAEGGHRLEKANGRNAELPHYAWWYAANAGDGSYTSPARYGSYGGTNRLAT